MPRRARRADPGATDDDPVRGLVEALAAQAELLDRYLQEVYEESFVETTEPGHLRLTIRSPATAVSTVVEYRRGSDEVSLEVEVEGEPGAAEPDQSAIAGLHRGIVVDATDPEGLGRLLVRIPSLSGEATSWALPCITPGAGALPTAGETVWIAFEAGGVESPVWLGRLSG